MPKGLTEYGNLILNLIESSEKPLCAKSILGLISIKTNLSTVYRTLEYLRESKLINSVAFTEGTNYYYSMKKHQHFLYCEVCHEIIEFCQCNAGVIEENLKKEYGYKITNHVLYFTGICVDCQKHLDKINRNKEVL